MCPPTENIVQLLKRDEIHDFEFAVRGSMCEFINYWVDAKAGVVMCLSEAPDSDAVTNTHKEAHGLLPKNILTVKQGQ